MFGRVLKVPGRVVAAFVAVLTLCGCSSTPVATLEPVTVRAEGAKDVAMLVATTRKAAGPGLVFSGERGRTLGFAEIVISVPADSARTPGEVQRPKRHPGNPEKEFVARKVDVLDAGRAYGRFTQMLAEPKNRGRAFLFVHGYNNRFDDAVLRFAQIVHDSKAPGVPVLFTWPSRGETLAYPYDHESGSYSRDALASALERLAGDVRVKEISILAHSMGNWVTMEALRTMALKHGRVHPKIVDVMLAAPDIDVDVFHTQLRSFGQSPPNMTLFVSRDDKALKISKRFWGDVPRLGAIDPAQEPYAGDIEKARISVVDLTKVSGDDFLHHGKFASSPEVVRLIGYRLSQGQTLHDSNDGFAGDLVSAATDAGAGIGAVAGHVLTAPLRMTTTR